MITVHTRSKLSTLFGVEAVVIDGKPALAVIWTGDNFYSLQKLANDRVEVIMDPLAGKFETDIEGIKKGSLLYRFADAEYLTYKPMNPIPDLSEYPLSCVDAYELVAPEAKK